MPKNQISDASLRLVTLVGIAAAAFLIPSGLVVMLLAAASLLLCLSNPLTRQPSIDALYKLRYLAILIVLSYAGSVGPAATSQWTVSLGLVGLHLSFNPEGVLAGVLVVSKIGTMIALSAWLIASSSSEAVAAALSFVFRAEWLGAVISRCLGLVASRGQRRAKTKTGTALKHDDESDEVSSHSKKSTVARIRQRVQALIERWLLEAHAKFSGGYVGDDEIGLIGLCCLAVLSPGHKNIFIIPIFIFAAAASTRPWTATKVGLSAGLLNFLLGFGKYGPLEIFQFLLPGLAIDLLYPTILLAAGKPRLGIIIFAFVGIIAGLFRFSGNALALLLTGTPILLLLAMIPALMSQIVFAILGSVLSGAWAVELAARFQSDLAKVEDVPEEARNVEHVEE
jgi:hypothetical protein